MGTWELAQSRERRRLGVLGRFAGYFGGLGATSLVAGAATLLFSAYHFQQTSPLGVLGNLLSMPLVGFLLMPAALISVLLMPLGLEGAPLQLVGWTIERMLDIGSLVAGWSAGLDASPLLAPSALIIGMSALAWFAFLGDRYRLIGPMAVIPAIAILAMDQPPDLLVADTTQATALRTAEGLQLVAGKPDSFAVEVWAETYGPIAAPSQTLMRCDSIACVGEAPSGFRLAVISDPAGFAEDCGRADLVVTRLLAPSYCYGLAAVIDAADLHRKGAHWVRWRDGAFEIRPAISDQDRPWRPSLP